jgi:hypothetical protein
VTNPFVKTASVQSNRNVVSSRGTKLVRSWRREHVGKQGNAFVRPTLEESAVPRILGPGVMTPDAAVVYARNNRFVVTVSGMGSVYRSQQTDVQIVVVAREAVATPTKPPDAMRMHASSVSVKRTSSVAFCHGVPVVRNWRMALVEASAYVSLLRIQGSLVRGSAVRSPRPVVLVSLIV